MDVEESHMFRHTTFVSWKMNRSDALLRYQYSEADLVFSSVPHFSPCWHLIGQKRLSDLKDRLCKNSMSSLGLTACFHSGRTLYFPFLKDLLCIMPSDITLQEDKHRITYDLRLIQSGHHGKRCISLYESLYFPPQHGILKGMIISSVKSYQLWSTCICKS